MTFLIQWELCKGIRWTMVSLRTKCNPEDSQKLQKSQWKRAYKVYKVSFLNPTAAYLFFLSNMKLFSALFRNNMRLLIDNCISGSLAQTLNNVMSSRDFDNINCKVFLFFTIYTLYCSPHTYFELLDKASPHPFYMLSWI